MEIFLSLTHPVKFHYWVIRDNSEIIRALSIHCSVIISKIHLTSKGRNHLMDNPLRIYHTDLLMSRLQMEENADRWRFSMESSWHKRIFHRKQRVVNNLNTSSESKIETPSMNKIILHQRQTRLFKSHVGRLDDTPFNYLIRNLSTFITNATFSSHVNDRQIGWL